MIPTEHNTAGSLTELPTTTVIIAAFNAEAFLADAIHSVLAQSRPVAEILVVDDGSVDRTAEIAASLPGVTLIRQTNAGPAAARNRGLAVASGEYVAMLDADDLWPPDRQEILAGVLDREPTLGVVIGSQTLLIEPGADLPDWVPAGDPDSFRPTDLPRPTGSFLARRRVFDQIGVFDERMRHGEDTDWFIRVHDSGIGVLIIDDVVLHRRIHGANLTHDSDAQRRAFFEVLSRRMARRRDSSVGGQAAEIPGLNDGADP